MLAFYYAWYDQNTWQSGKTADLPVLPYNSNDRETIARHVEQARQAGIDAFVVAWLGPANPTDDNLATMLSVAQDSDFRVSLYFETDSPFIHNQGDVVNALHHALATHANHPHFLRYEGKPVLFFWQLSAVPTAPGQSAVDAWASIRNQVDPDRSTIWIAEGSDLSYLRVFDGHHLYSIAWSKNVNNTLTKWGERVRGYNAQHGTRRLWVATVMPGYNDLPAGRANAFVRTREEGRYYRDTWQAAINSDPDWIIITSFNEWVEGSQIEPSLTYGNLYLNLTKELSTQFKAGVAIVSTELDEVSAATAPSPTATPQPTATPTPIPTATPTPTLTSGHARSSSLPAFTRTRVTACHHPSTGTPTLTLAPTPTTKIITTTPRPTATPTPIPHPTLAGLSASDFRRISFGSFTGAAILGALLLWVWWRER